MAKTQKPNDEEKIVKENIQKRFQNMFTGENQPLSNMSLKEVEALKARVAELEALVAGQPTVQPESQPVPSPAEPVVQPPARIAAWVPMDQHEPAVKVALENRITQWVAGISAVVSLELFAALLYIVFFLQGGMMELSDKVLIPLTVVMFISNLSSLRFARHNQPILGAWITYLSSAILAPILVVLVLENSQIVMGGYLVLFSLLFIIVIFPKASRLQASLVAVGGVLILAAVEIWNPAFRLSAAHIQNYTVMILGPAALGIFFILIATRQLQNPRIQVRVTVLLIVFMVPFLAAISMVITSLARSGMEAGANTQLQGNSTGLASGISTWLELNTDALEGLALQPDITSMNAEEQRPVLQAMAKAHPYMYLVSTTDLNGMNVARNDNGKLTDYSDRAWFQGAKSGAPITYQTLIGKTSGQPALVVSVPIKNASGTVVGVAMFAADLTDLAKEVRVSKIGERGFTFLVDANNQALAHPDEKVTAELTDMSNYPPVVALHQGKTGMITFTDESGERWRAYISTLDNGWAIITQQPESEILAQINRFQSAVILLVLFGGIVMLALVWFVTRRTLQPITALTDTVSAIAAGDLNRTVEVKAQDEIGKLAHTFNTMTAQIRNLVGNLEQRVADRTHDLELAAEVGRTVTERVTHLSEMLTEATEMIRARFDLYYTQIYLTDPAGERIVLRAGTGEVGKELVRRGHNLVINSGSLNGRAVLQRQTQIVGDTKEDKSFLPNRLLPDTRSEMCVPLIADEKVVGILDMQSKHPGTFSESNLPAFEALAGQLAVAIRNAALFTEVQETRSEVEAQMSRFTEQGWGDFLNAIHQGHKVGFAFEKSQVVRLEPETLSPMSNADCLNLPIAVAGARVGEIQLPANLKPGEVELVKAVGEQLAQHVENLRLLAQAEIFRKEAEIAVRRLTREGWDTYFTNADQTELGYVYDLNQVQPLSEDGSRSRDRSFRQPLVVRDESIGELKLDLPEVTDETAEIISAVAQQLSGHLETLRLSELTERHAQREQTLRQLTSALRSSTNPTTIMRTAVREVGKILGRRTVVQVVPPEPANQAEAGQGNANETDSPADRS